MADEVVMLRGIRCIVDQCGTCGIPDAVPAKVYEHHREHGGYSHCPNGHQWGWTGEESEMGRLRRERDLLKQRQARLEEEADEQRRLRLTAERITAEELRKRRRLEQRMQHGVCGHCNRTFANLARHMASKHPPKQACVACATQACLGTFIRRIILPAERGTLCRMMLRCEVVKPAANAERFRLVAKP